MTIEVYRTDLTTKDPPEKLGGYESSLYSVLEYMKDFADQEAASRDDVDHVARITDKCDDLRITRYTLIGNAPHRPSLVEYTYRIVED